MATDTPLIETLFSYLETELSNISVDNSYRSNVAYVSRVLKDYDELMPENYPALFPILGTEQISKQTNREVESVIDVVIYGYVYFNETGETNQMAALQLNNLISDVKEKMINLFQTTKFNSTSETFSTGSVETDEGIFDPYSAFRIVFQIGITYAYDNTGRSVQS